jgi:Spy/CpxP family protein refolding chaperone
VKTGQAIKIMAIMLAIAISTAVFNSPAVADEKPDPAEQRLTIMKEKLDLTDGQVNEIRAIMQMARLEAERDREKFRETRDREEARKAAEARQKETDKKIKTVLNEKQRKEYDKLKEELRQRRENRGDRPGGKRDGMRDGKRGGRGNR